MRLSAVVTVLAAVALPALAAYHPPYGGKPTPTLPCDSTPTCAASGQPCELPNPGACCSQTCINADPQPTCA
ncbi:unnamed protein product [Rhizoctonia solani]|uniref:WAP domain-containing protein n=1 Tax=Rhizoctonia solani TaxID=456999 RepID=A0A8H3C5U3_9AGAM|nr:unnamed protein product [Rhizoctonia solani]